MNRSQYREIEKNPVADSLNSSGGERMSVRLAGVILRVEMIVVAGTFVVFSFLHLGTHPLGIAEPRILPATIVEAACGLGLVVAAAATLAGSPRAWSAAVSAHVLAIAGVLLGLWAQARGTGGTDLNAIYHRTVLAILIVGLALLLTRRGRVALRSAFEGTAQRRGDHD
jgi:hypothetical protein